MAGAVVVPALLESAAHVEGLRKAIAQLRGTEMQVVVSVEGEAALLRQSVPFLRHCRVVESTRKTGKWRAFVRGLAYVNPHAEWVACVDADGAFAVEDLLAVVQPITSRATDHVIGQRRPRGLASADPRSERSRIYVEVFFNTLTLLIARRNTQPSRGFDIQCGLHAFSNERARVVRHMKMPKSGGALLLFWQSARRSATVQGIAIGPTVAPPESTHRVSEIVNELWRLEFVSGVDPSVVSAAVSCSPRWYRKWIPEAFRDEYLAEINDVVLPLRP